MCRILTFVLAHVQLTVTGATLSGTQAHESQMVRAAVFVGVDATEDARAWAPAYIANNENDNRHHNRALRYGVDAVIAGIVEL